MSEPMKLSKLIEHLQQINDKASSDCVVWIELGHPGASGWHHALKIPPLDKEDNTLPFYLYTWSDTYEENR